jgi:3-dehydroquinate synthase
LEGLKNVKILYVDLKTHRYPIFVGPGLIADAGSLLRKQGLDTPPIVISNPTILRLHGAALINSLDRAFGRPSIIQIGDGERFKNHATLMKIYDGMFRAHADRRSWILAFGGGIIGDLAGFAAASFMRGISYVMAPTTLLAQVDSSIGGKVGLNVAQGKNLIGAFYQPSAVISDTAVLKTLPKRELSAGLYEAIKCGAIRSKSLLRYLDRRLPEILKCRSAEMDHVVVAAARIKAEVVASDEKESGLRMILNYGHTIGHAFEAATNYKRFKHGEAVAWGMMAALEYGRELGLAGDGEAAQLTSLIIRLGGLPPIKDIFFADLWNALVRDKKFRSGDIRMIFLRRLGEAEIHSGIDGSSLRNFLKRFLAGSERFV